MGENLPQYTKKRVKINPRVIPKKPNEKQLELLNKTNIRNFLIIYPNRHFIIALVKIKVTRVTD